jgi:glyoxylase-like metal-dependent hydrolase (beta-lactamase superfamily II)
MAIGDLFEVTEGTCEDVYYVDTGMYGSAEYGSVYFVDAAEPALVDSGIGTGYEHVLDGMAEVGLAPEDLEHVALTHVHLDHAGGAGYLVDTCPNATVAVHELGARHLVDPGRLVEGPTRAVGDPWEFYAEPEPIDADRIRELSDGDTVDLGDRELRVHHTPGHAPHQVVFEESDDAVVFTADAAGIYVPTLDRVRHTTPPPTYDQERAVTDVHAIAALEPSVLCYSHFGSAPTDDRLRTYADVLTEWVARVAEERERLGDDEAVADHLAPRTEVEGVWGQRKARAEERMNVRGVCTYLDDRGRAGAPD